MKPSKLDPAPPPHLDGRHALAFVNAEPLADEVMRHVRTGCEPCHELIQGAFDRVLTAIELGEDSRDVRDWLKRLGDRYTRRHCCPVSLVEDLVADDERAHRHLRHCSICANELRELDELSRLEEGPNGSGTGSDSDAERN